MRASNKKPRTMAGPGRKNEQRSDLANDFHDRLHFGAFSRLPENKGDDPTGL
jgi:hypothetical protein